MMMNTLRSVVQSKVQYRQFHKCFRYCQIEVATVPVEKMTIPAPESSDMAVSPKIEKIFQEISSLNLIEVAQLSDVLKKRLNLPDAPVMAMAGPAVPAEEEASKSVQCSFTVKLTKYDEKQKIALIKQIKSLLPDMNLVQAKKFVESTPAVVKSDVSKDEAEQLKKSLCEVGGDVEIS